jgi:hypothetical protein
VRENNESDAFPSQALSRRLADRGIQLQSVPPWQVASDHVPSSDGGAIQQTHTIDEGKAMSNCSGCSAAAARVTPKYSKAARRIFAGPARERARRR